jgi:hypothetical protein
MIRIRHGMLLGAFLGTVGLAAEILRSHPDAEEAGRALRWTPAYALTGALLGLLTAFLVPLLSGRRAQERGPGLLLLGTMSGLAILGGTFLPQLIFDKALPALAPAVLGLGIAAGVHLLGLAAAGAASAWRVESFVSAVSAGAGLFLVLLLTLGGTLFLPDSTPDPDAPAPAGAKPLNVVVVVLDGVRADHLGSFGSFRAASPRFDALAGESVLFEQAFTASPEHLESLARLLGWPGGSLAPALANAGWQTWAVSADAGALDPVNGPLRNFNRQVNVLTGGLSSRLFLARCAEQLGVGGTAARSLRPADQVTARAIELAAARDPLRPFFLLAHLTDATPPYDPPAELRDRFLPDGLSSADLLREVQDQDPLRLSMIELGKLTASAEEAQAFAALYDAEILAQDAALGRLVDGLLDLGLLEDTLLVVTADHGIRFGEEAGRLGHAGSLHDAVLRVPLLLRLPRLLPAGTVARGLVSLEDLAPAIRALLTGAQDGFLLAAAGGATPRRAVTVYLVEDGRTLTLVRGEHEKILLGAPDQVIAAGDLLADPDESFLRLRPPLDPDAAARWRARAAELSNGSAVGAGGSGTDLRRD